MGSYGAWSVFFDFMENSRRRLCEDPNRLLACEILAFWYKVLFCFSGKEGPSIVAVKTLKENATEKEKSDLIQELEVMKMLDPHQNVVRLIGCCTEKGNKESYLIST